MWDRIAILGTGLIGGSMALALRRHSSKSHLVGWDRPEVLTDALERGAVDEVQTDLAAALRGANLVYIALPIGRTLDLLPEIARLAEPHALVSDACSTKGAVCAAAGQHFRGVARFLGGHPMAGKETGGIKNADADLFRGAKYVLVAEAAEPDERVKKFAALVEAVGAQPVWLDAKTHDWAVAIISQLPQLAAVALAGVVHDETDETGLPLALAGPGLRDTLRLAGSPYELWRDIALTNRENLARALDRLAQAVDHLRGILASRELKDEFEAANHIYQILRNLK